MSRVRPWLRCGLAGAALLLGFASGAAPTTPAETLDLHPVALYGADIRSLVFDPANPDRAFAGTSAGHIYLSEDGGSSFRNAGAEIPFPGWVVGALVVDANRPGRLWAALWGIWGGGRVAFSDDSGQTWTLRDVSANGDAQVYSLATVPGRPDRLFAGTRAGVEISDDAGRTFRPVGRDLPGLIHVSSLHVDGEQPEIVVAGTWRRAYRSMDGGETWQGVFEGMVLDSEVFSLHAAADRPGELWASTCGWVYRGDALGATWTRFTTGLAEKRTPSFAVLPGERLLAGTVAGAFLSTNRGASFRRTTPDSLAVLAIAYHPARPERILIGTEGAGIWSSTDGGETFRARPVGMRNLRVPALDHDGDHLFAAVAHAGPASGVYRSPDGGSSFEPLPSELPTVLAMVTAGDRFFVATERGLFERVRPTSDIGLATATPMRFDRIPELGERRVEQLAATPERVVARTREGLYEMELLTRGARFRALHLGSTSHAASPSPPSPPSLRSAALAAGDLWVLRDDGLSRMVNGKLQAASLPYPAAATSELFSVAGDLHYSGKGGLFRRDTGTGAWMPLRSGPVRTLATGSARFPYLVESQGALALLVLPGDSGQSSAGEGAWLGIDLPFPARETLSALVTGDRLLLGSSGFGVWQALLPAVPPMAGDAQRSVSSEARIRR